jgi:hypothetical protein
MPIKQLTRAQLSFDTHAFVYHVPRLAVNQPHEELVNQWVDLARAHPFGHAVLTEVKHDRSAFIRFFYRYEGWDEYHPFQITTRLLWLTDTEQLVVQGWIEQDVHDLMEVIIRTYLLPAWEDALGLWPV